jgi:hypothetical protein
MAISSALGTGSLTPGVCTSSTRPTAPFEGQMIYETDTDRVLIWNNSAWVAPNSQTANPPGLELIKTQAVGTAVTSVTVTDAFNANYENYKITYSGGTQSADSSLDILIGGSTTGYFGILVYALVTGSLTFAAMNNSSNFAWIGGAAAGQASHAEFELFAPFQARYTKIRNGQYQNGANYGVVNGEHRVATSYSSFTLQVPSGTMTGGTIRVYGIRN